ncbi:hypothetical protein ACFQHN_04650 [Natrialbaceae archaeon GCM10025896]
MPPAEHQRIGAGDGEEDDRRGESADADGGERVESVSRRTGTSVERSIDGERSSPVDSLEQALPRHLRGSLDADAL